MRRILILSDTHGYFDNRFAPYILESDEVWHAGDWGGDGYSEKLESHKPIKGVYGNIDGKPIRDKYELSLTFSIEGVKICITHIAGNPGKYSEEAAKLITDHKPDILICGHSHILKVMRDKANGNLLFINPGAAGIHGFHKVQTAIRLKIDNGKVFDLDVIEFPRSTFKSN